MNIKDSWAFISRKHGHKIEAASWVLISVGTLVALTLREIAK